VTAGDDDAVPTAGPAELTYRVGWEVVEMIADQVTIRIREPEPAPEDSDGIPQAVDGEISLRGIVSSGHVTADTYVLTDAEKVEVMHAVAELAYRHGHGDVIEYPIKTPGGVKVLVLRWRAFARWFLSLDELGFTELQPYLRGLPHRTRSGGYEFLSALARIIPGLRQFDDTPHLLLEL
jgi:hypothetical protein